MKKIKIEGMHCQNCVQAVENGLKKLEPKSLKVEIGEAEIDTDASDDVLKEAIEDLGFDVVSIN
ncbi:MAG: cation transporter [Andreesenia angusta]|nr:cation transporter [Andreesenia angusta]